MGGGGAPKSYKRCWRPPLSVIEIVKYCGVREGGGIGVAPKSYKNNSVPHLCHYDSKVFWNRGGVGHWGGAIILQNDNGAPSLSVIKIVKYCGVWGGGAKILQKIIAPPSLCH